MKKIILNTLLFSLFSLCLMGQSIEDLKEMQMDKKSKVADLQSKIDGLNTEVDGLQAEIDKLSGWRKGVTGLVGFDWNRSNGWIANPNPDAKSASLNIGLTGYILNDKEKYFWHNKGIVQKAWNDVDLSDADDVQRDANGDIIPDVKDGLFRNGTVDILNLSSLAGYKLSKTFAISGLAELNTSIGNFLEPGTLDIGVGATWLPIQNMTVVVHPLNYHYAWPSQEEKAKGVNGISSTGAFGAKVRIDYFQDFNIAGKPFKWSSTLTSFLPYSDKKQAIRDANNITIREAGLFEYTWINTFTFEVWRGIGVGLGVGIRSSDFESSSLQSYTNFGLSYGF